jgi:alcohol dehydrogenase (cytochrome c)
MGKPGLLRTNAGRAAVFALLLCMGAAVAVPALRWRFQVLGLHLAGKIPDIETAELMAFLMPGSEQSLARLPETRNPHAILSNKRTAPDDLATGAQLFRTRCADCHGLDARGGARAPSLVGRTLNAGASDWAIYRTIRSGVPNTAMMPHPELSAMELWQLVGFIRSVDSSNDSSDARPARLLNVSLPYEELRAAIDPRRDWLTFSGSYSGARHSALTQINTHNVRQLSLRWMHALKALANLSPIVRNGIMFVTLPGGEVAALDGASGEVIWSRQLGATVAMRGVALMGDRVFAASTNTRLAALSASTGKTLWEAKVAEDASVYLMTSAPLAYRDLVVTGVATTEGGRGYVVAYDAATGKERWRFYTIPAKGEPHNDTWAGDSWREGGAPTWLSGSYDPDLDLLYWGVGNPKPDYDAHLRKGDNLYSNSVVALNGSTGKLAWYFQFTPADNRDWDANQIPILAERDSPTGKEKLLLFANRNGFYYVLDRVTGKFLHAEPFVHQNWTRGIDANGRPLPPPAKAKGTAGNLMYPGNVGGTNWWPPSYDAQLNLVFVPVIEQGMVFFDSNMSWPTASNRPFYTAIRALDARTGKLVWEQRSAPRTMRNQSTGVVSTDGGLLFASDMTQFFALDSRTGAKLWFLETGGYISAAPVVYEANGTQFVTVAAGNNLLTFALVPMETEGLLKVNSAESPGSPQSSAVAAVR